MTLKKQNVRRQIASLCSLGLRTRICSALYHSCTNKCFLYSHSLSPPPIKDYRSCLASVLSRKGKASEVQAKTLSEMITFMELQRPRITPVLSQWDLGIMLEAYESLLKVSLKHLTLKTVFLLAMASTGKIQALVFNPKYIQFKPKVAGVTLYFSPEFMWKIRDLIMSMTPGTFEQSLLASQVLTA